MTNNVYTIPASAAAIKADTLRTVELEDADLFPYVTDEGVLPTVKFSTRSDGYGNLRTIVQAGLMNREGALIAYAHPYEVLAPAVSHKAVDRRLTPAENAQRTLGRFLAVDPDVYVTWATIGS